MVLKHTYIHAYMSIVTYLPTCANIDGDTDILNVLYVQYIYIDIYNYK